MIGLIPRTWITMLQQLSDAPTLEAILLDAGLPADRKFALDQPCDDADFLRMVHASVQRLGQDLDTLTETFAEVFLQDALQRWPVWFEMAPDARSFLERQPRIHGSFARSLEHSMDASAPEAPKFAVTSIDDGLRVEYRSANHLCGMYKSLARAVLRHYRDDSAILEEPLCVHHGHDHCEIHVRWPR